MRFGAQQARRIGEHGPWVRLREALAAQDVQEYLRVAPPHVGITRTLDRAVAEIAPAVDHLLG